MQTQLRLGLLALVLGACNQEPPIPTRVERQSQPASKAVSSLREAHPPKPRLSPRQPPDAEKAFERPEGLALTWKVPPSWKQVPSRSRMRKATYEVSAPSPGSGKAELAVFYFGPQGGGSVDANIDRWVNQFRDVPEQGVSRSKRETHGLEQHIVEISSGTYSNRMGPMAADAEPQRDYALLGAVVGSESGNYFFKLTGPRDTVKAQRGAFFELLDSLKASAPD